MVCLDSCMPLSCLFFVTWMCTYVHLYIDYVLEHSRPASVCLLQLCAYLNNQRRYIIFMWYNTAKTRGSKRLYLSRGCAKKQSATTGILLLLIGRLKVGQPEGGKMRDIVLAYTTTPVLKSKSKRPRPGSNWRPQVYHGIISPCDRREWSSETHLIGLVNLC